MPDDDWASPIDDDLVGVAEPKSVSTSVPVLRAQIIPGWRVRLNTANTDLIRGVIPGRGLGMIVGPYGSAKSYLGLHIARCISRGEPFFDRATERAGALYVAAEAAGTFDRRVVAHHFTQQDAFGVVLSAIDFGARAGDEVRELIYQIGIAKLAAPIRAVFIDTLARSGLRAENDSEAMAALIENCAAVEQAIGGVVIGIHHQGWDAKHSRGHSSLPAACDFELSTSKNGEVFTAEITKSREGPIGEKFRFKLTPVDVGTGADGHTTTACLLEPINEPETLPAQRRKLAPAQKIALDALIRAVGDHGIIPPFDGAPGTRRAVTVSQWRTYHLSDAERPPDIRPDTWHRKTHRTREWLQAHEIVIKKGDFVWPSAP